MERREVCCQSAPISKRCTAIPNTQGGSRAMLLFEVLTTEAT